MAQKARGLRCLLMIPPRVLICPARTTMKTITRSLSKLSHFPACEDCAHWLKPVRFPAGRADDTQGSDTQGSMDDLFGRSPGAARLCGRAPFGEPEAVVVVRHKRFRNNCQLLLFAPPPAPLRARNHFHASHRSVLCAGPNLPGCTNARTRRNSSGAGSKIALGSGPFFPIPISLPLQVC
jgi:hypothetical protein